MKQGFTLNRTYNAPIDRVFAAFTDHRSYAKTMPFRKSTLDKEGTTDPNGLGAVRRLELIGPPVLEEVVGYEPSTYFAYKVLKGLPVKEHLGEVRLSDHGGTTQCAYTLSFTPTIPGPFVSLIMKPAIKQIMNGVAKVVE
jgi:uncharacterized protein YndB with AHSA1/START domain